MQLINQRQFDVVAASACISFAFSPTPPSSSADPRHHPRNAAFAPLLFTFLLAFVCFMVAIDRAMLLLGFLSHRQAPIPEHPPLSDLAAGPQSHAHLQFTQEISPYAPLNTRQGIFPSPRRPPSQVKTSAAAAQVASGCNATRRACTPGTPSEVKTDAKYAFLGRFLSFFCCTRLNQTCRDPKMHSK